MYMPRLFPGSRSWTLYQDFASAMRERGHHFEIFTDRRPGGPPPVDDPHTHYLTPRPAPLAMDRWLAPLVRSQQLLGTARSLVPVLRERRDLELVYVEIAYPYGAAVDLAMSRSGWKGALVVKPTGEDVLLLPEAAYGVRRYVVPRLLVARTLWRAAAIRCISSLVVEAVAPFGSQPRAIIPSAVDNATISTAAQSPEIHRERRASARETLRAATGATRRHLVMALGRLHPFKGLAHLLETMADVPDADLVIAGPSATVSGFGDYRTFLRELAARRGLSDRVIFMDTVTHDEVLRTLAGADLVVVPSLVESMNKVCVEAAAVRTPFVVTSTTGVSTYLDERGVGEVVPPRDRRALASAIRGVLDGRWQRDEAATLRFVNRFAPSVVAAAMSELFARALEARGAGPARG
jgi:glycosyltransferase involved in cell wall biosynthesis